MIVNIIWNKGYATMHEYGVAQKASGKLFGGLYRQRVFFYIF